MIIYILATSTGPYHFTIYFGHTSCPVNPWFEKKKNQNKNHGEPIQHTKELLAHQQPSVCRSGGKRKVRKLKSGEGGQWGKGKSRRKEGTGSENNRTRRPVGINTQSAKWKWQFSWFSTSRAVCYQQWTKHSLGWDSRFPPTTQQGFLAMGKKSSGTSRYQVCFRNMCSRPFL